MKNTEAAENLCMYIVKKENELYRSLLLEKTGVDIAIEQNKLIDRIEVFGFSDKKEIHLDGRLLLTIYKTKFQFEENRLSGSYSASLTVNYKVENQNEQ